MSAIHHAEMATPAAVKHGKKYGYSAQKPDWVGKGTRRQTGCPKIEGKWIEGWASVPPIRGPMVVPVDHMTDRRAKPEKA